MNNDITGFVELSKGLLVENARWHKWVGVSHTFGNINQWFGITIQSLGRLDCELIYEDTFYLSLPKVDKETISESFKWSGRYTLSYLWILGLYELIRTLDQKCSENPQFLTPSFNNEIKEFKKKIERLRIPLAKFEPSRRHPSDSPIAYPACHQDLGISWQISLNKFISRRELSNDTLDLFTRINQELKNV